MTPLLCLLLCLLLWTVYLTAVQPYRINFEDLSCGSIFHQCVYLLCCQDTATLGAGQTAREVFGQEPSQPYMPHLSLLYSDMDQDSR